VVSGTPLSWSFNSASKTFALRFSTARAGGGARFGTKAITEIAAPALVYNGRYGATVAGGRPVSKPGASTLQVVACRGAITVTVTVRPGGVNRGSCRASAGHGRPAPRPHGRRPKAGPSFTG
jgi:hypothetical protein